MSAAAFSILLLASGYIALRCTPFTRFHILRAEGHGLYFLVVASALAVSAFVAITVNELFKIPVLGMMIRVRLESFLATLALDPNSAAFGSIATLSVPIAFAMARLLGLPLSHSTTLRSRLLIGLNSVGELEGFLWASAAKDLPVMLTMSSGTAYVGSTIDTATPRDHRSWIRLEPLISGFIDESHRFCPVTIHAWPHGMPRTGDFLALDECDVLLPLDEVRSAHVFDLPAYEHDLAGNTGPKTKARLSSVQTQSHMPKAIRFYAAYACSLVSLPIASLWGGPYLLAVVSLICVVFALASALPEDP